MWNKAVAESGCRVTGVFCDVGGPFAAAGWVQLLDGWEGQSGDYICKCRINVAPGSHLAAVVAAPSCRPVMSFEIVGCCIQMYRRRTGSNVRHVMAADSLKTEAGGVVVMCYFFFFYCPMVSAVQYI